MQKPTEKPLKVHLVILVHIIALFPGCVEGEKCSGNEASMHYSTKYGFHLFIQECITAYKMGYPHQVECMFVSIMVHVQQINVLYTKLPGKVMLDN